MSWDGGSGYKTYIFEESIRRCTINCKGRGRKEVIYLRVADVSCTRGVTYARARGSPMEAPAVGFRDNELIQIHVQLKSTLELQIDPGPSRLLPLHSITTCLISNNMSSSQGLLWTLQESFRQGLDANSMINIWKQRNYRMRPI